MRLVGKGELFSGAPTGPEAFCCFPSLCRLSDGDLLAAFQCGPAKNHANGTVLLSRSTDDGVSWGAPTAPFRAWAAGRGLTVHVGYLTEVSPDRLVAALMLCDHLGDATLPFFNPATGGVLPITIGLAESGDQGRTWREPDTVATGRFDDVSVPVMSPVRIASDGTWLLPFETTKRYHDTGPADHYAACLLSGDAGGAWDRCVTVAHDPAQSFMYWDQRMLPLDRNRCVAFFWTMDTGRSTDTTVHRSLSTDGGRTWPDVPRDTGLVGQSTWPVWLGGDRLVALTVDRYGEGVIKACASRDLGGTWDQEMVLHKQALSGTRATNVAENLSEQQRWSFGLPSGIPNGRDEILAVWYSGSPAHTAIYWARAEARAETRAS